MSQSCRAVRLVHVSLVRHAGSTLVWAALLVGCPTPDTMLDAGPLDASLDTSRDGSPDAVLGSDDGGPRPEIDAPSIIDASSIDSAAADTSSPDTGAEDGGMVGVCPAGYDSCGTVCSSTTSPASCAPTCTGLSTCGPSGCTCAPGGACSCEAPDTSCGGTCVDRRTSTAHCGVCGNACRAGEICFEGACTCGPTLRACADGCYDFRTDELHCGACDVACGVGQTCSSGLCTGGPHPCGDTSSDPDNCGTCGNACASRYCTGGTCRACPGSSCSGVCGVDLGTDAENCGACGRWCPSGTCTASTCAPCPVAQCSGLCVDTMRDSDHCGACGAACLPGTQCVAGACRGEPVEALIGAYEPGGIRAWTGVALIDGRVVSLDRFVPRDYAVPAARIVAIGPITGGRVPFVNQLGDVYEHDVDLRTGRWATFGATDLADTRAIVACDGRFLVDRTPIDGITNVVRATPSPCGYLVLSGDGTLFQVDGTTYTGSPLASGVTSLEWVGPSAVWVDATGGLHRDCGTAPIVTGVRLATPVDTRGSGTYDAFCFVRPDDTTGCRDRAGTFLSVPIPTAVAHDAVQLIHGNQDIGGGYTRAVYLRTAAGRVWSWAIQQPFLPGDVFRVTTAPRQIAGPP